MSEVPLYLRSGTGIFKGAAGSAAVAVGGYLCGELRSSEEPRNRSNPQGRSRTKLISHNDLLFSSIKSTPPQHRQLIVYYY